MCECVCVWLFGFGFRLVGIVTLRIYSYITQLNGTTQQSSSTNRTTPMLWNTISRAYHPSRLNQAKPSHFRSSSTISLVFYTLSPNAHPKPIWKAQYPSQPLTPPFQSVCAAVERKCDGWDNHFIFHAMDILFMIETENVYYGIYTENSHLDGWRPISKLIKVCVDLRVDTKSDGWWWWAWETRKWISFRIHIVFFWSPLNWNAGRKSAMPYVCQWILGNFSPIPAIDSIIGWLISINDWRQKDHRKSIPKFSIYKIFKWNPYLTEHTPTYAHIPYEPPNTS